LRKICSGGGLTNHDGEYEPLGYALFDGIDPRGIPADLLERFFIISVESKEMSELESLRRQNAKRFFKGLRWSVWEMMKRWTREVDHLKRVREDLLTEETERLGRAHGVSGRPLWVAVPSAALRLLDAPPFVLKSFESWLQRHMSTSADRAVSRTTEFIDHLVRFAATGAVVEDSATRRALWCSDTEIRIAYSQAHRFVVEKIGSNLGFSVKDLLEELGLAGDETGNKDNAPSSKHRWVRLHRPSPSQSGGLRFRMLSFELEEPSVPKPLKQVLFELRETLRSLRS